jgi:hypothetical protein
MDIWFTSLIGERPQETEEENDTGNSQDRDNLSRFLQDNQWLLHHKDSQPLDCREDFRFKYQAFIRYLQRCNLFCKGRCIKCHTYIKLKCLRTHAALLLFSRLKKSAIQFQIIKHLQMKNQQLLLQLKTDGRLDSNDNATYFLWCL